MRCGRVLIGIGVGVGVGVGVGRRVGFIMKTSFWDSAKQKRIHAMVTLYNNIYLFLFIQKYVFCENDVCLFVAFDLFF